MIQLDGDALKELTTDFDEFSTLETAPLARLKIKKMVREIESSSSLAGRSKHLEEYSIIGVKSNILSQCDMTIIITLIIDNYLSSIRLGIYM